MRAKGEGLLAAGMKNIKMLLPKKDLPICEMVESLMDQRPPPQAGVPGGGGEPDKYLYIDPNSAQLGGMEAPLIRSTMKRAIVFVVVGGNFTEQQSLQEWAIKGGRHVIYGATDFVSPTQFVDELNRLGRMQG